MVTECLLQTQVKKETRQSDWLGTADRVLQGL